MGERMTIEELAAATGMTVRNLREHQTRGLLPAPAIEGRKGYYDRHHLARVRLIQRLQDQGLNLQAIAWLLERAPVEATDEIVRFEQALFAPWGEAEPVTYTTAELGAVFGPAPPEVTRRALDLGFLRRLDEDHWEVVSPALADAGRELAAAGIPIDASLDVFEGLTRHAEAISRAFVGLFIEQVWEPFDAAGRPPERWAEVRQTLERMRPIAAEALLAVFRRTMTAAVAEWSEAITAGVGERDTA